MDIETLLRLAKKQSQWNAFVSNIRRSTTPEELAKTAIETNNYTNFLENAFYWTGTKEGYAFWYKTTMNFCKVVRDYESSTPVFKAYEKKVLVARFVDWKDRRPEDIEKLKDLAAKTLNDNNIDFDLLVINNDEIKAFKREPYFVKE